MASLCAILSTSIVVIRSSIYKQVHIQKHMSQVQKVFVISTVYMQVAQNIQAFVFIAETRRLRDNKLSIQTVISVKTSNCRARVSIY